MIASLNKFKIICHGAKGDYTVADDSQCDF